MMSITLQKICESLRVEYGHHELWLDWREWPFRQHNPALERQPVVISCSGRQLAAWDGAGDSWSFVQGREQLSFDDQSDYFNPGRNKDNFLDARRIAELKEKYRF
ncbi:hypothetical protein ACSG99_004165 [Cronobacter sakazakii]